MSKSGKKKTDTSINSLILLNLKCGTNEPLYKIETDSTGTENRLVVAKGWRRRKG